MSNESFVWTDELVIEYAMAVATSKYPYFYTLENWKKFKQSHSIQQDNRDWEIVSFKDDEDIFYKNKKDDTQFFNGARYFKESWLIENAKIHSVKRKSDNTIFSVGDEISIGSDFHKILRIEFIDKTCVAHIPNGNQYSLYYAKLKPQPPSPKKEDRIEVDRVWQNGSKKMPDSEELFYNEFTTTYHVPNEKLPLIKEAIEQILNGLTPEDLKNMGIAKQMLGEYSLQRNAEDELIFGKRYTEKEIDDMCRDAFYAGKEREHIPFFNKDKFMGLKYLTYEDYKQSINKK